MMRLGLDLGTNSIGWALYRLAEDGEPDALVDGGVLIHPDGRDARTRASNAAARRSKRGPRRNRDRMLRRRRRVADLLDGLGLLPESREERIALRNLDLWRLRAEALDRALTPHELGRVLLAFVDRRGFKSNRKTDKGEGGPIREDTGKLRQRMAQSGARTLGEFLWRRRARGKTIRARLGNGLYPGREMVGEELRRIREAQAPHHGEIADEDWDEVFAALLHQRPLKPVEVGRCTFIPKEPRAHKAYPLFQEFRIRQEVLNLEAAPALEGFQPLNTEQRERIVAKLKSTGSLTFERIAALAGLPEGSRVNLATTARAGLDGDRTAAVLGASKRFGKRAWMDLGLERQQEVVERLLEDEDSEQVERWLRDEFGLSAAAAEAVASAPLAPGTGHLSKQAIGQLLPYMRDEGLPYDKAVVAAGLGHHSDHRGDGSASRLPYYGKVLERDVLGGRKDGPCDECRSGEGCANEAGCYGRITNPTVHIALGQMRRLFNAIVGAYGKPDEVVVELSRDLKQSREVRERDQRENRHNQERNERLRASAEAAGHPAPSPHLMRKLRLWEEQGPPNARLCPFTGEVLSIGRVLSDETEIEHIIPYSRSLDDSMANTVICTRSANREKGSRTPHEAWGSDPQRYHDIVARVATLPLNKQWRFLPDAMERSEARNDFLGRQLNDTRYLSRVTRDYLQAAVDPNRIWVTPGRLTAMLRRAWGLNRLLSDDSAKNRDDHRHHLIDAAVVGMTSRSLLQRVATESAREVDDLGGRVTDAVEDPWESFRNDVAAVVERCVVRHRPDHFQPARGGTTAGLHNETAYGVIDGPDDSGMMTLVETKTLASLDAARFRGLIDPDKVDGIRDYALRTELRALWHRVDGEEGSKAEKWGRFVERARREHGVRRVRVLVRLRQDSLAFIRDESGRVYKAYKTDGNAYMDIWRLPNGKTTGETASLFDAHQPGFRSSIKKNYPTARKLMRLHRDDMIAVGEGVERRILRVKELSRQKIVAVDNRQGGRAKEMVVINKRATRVLQEGIRKVTVDVLGRVQDGGPFGPDGRGRSSRS